MADLNDAPDLQTITASGVTGTDLFYVWDTSASVAKTITFTEQRKLTLEVVESAPTNGDAASVTLNPTGSNNDIKITAAAVGTAGNSLTAAIVIDATTDRTQLTVAKGGNAITITSGDKRQMLVTGTLTDGTDPVVFPSLDWVEGDDGWGNGGADYQLLRTLDPFGDPVDPDTYSLTSRNGPTRNWTAPYTPGGFPDGLTFTPISPATGTPTVTAAPATAAQAITAGNAALDETFENGAGSNGSGTIAAVTTTSLTGGTDASASNTPFLVNGSTLYVNVGTVAAPEWKEKDLDNLS